MAPHAARPGSGTGPRPRDRGGVTPPEDDFQEFMSDAVDTWTEADGTGVHAVFVCSYLAPGSLALIDSPDTDRPELLRLCEARALPVDTVRERRCFARGWSLLACSRRACDAPVRIYWRSTSAKTRCLGVNTCYRSNLLSRTAPLDLWCLRLRHRYLDLLLPCHGPLCRFPPSHRVLVASRRTYLRRFSRRGRHGPRMGRSLCCRGHPRPPLTNHLPLLRRCQLMGHLHHRRRGKVHPRRLPLPSPTPR